MPSVDERLTVLFWNIWVENQLTSKRLDALRKHFGALIEQYRPQAIGLNEVLADIKNGQPPILRFLEERGYHTHFEPFSPESNGRLLGSAFASLKKPLTIKSHLLGPDTAAMRRGHPGHMVTAIQAKLLHNGAPVNVVVSHLAHLVPYNWQTHVVHLRAFKKIAASSGGLHGNTILGGDFNQFKFMPRLWGAMDTYHRRTGSLIHPTWKWGGITPIIQANYDHIFWPKASQLLLDDFRVLPRDPSDHAPLLASFKLKA